MVFQSNAFQNNAFQILSIISAGGRIEQWGGTRLNQPDAIEEIRRLFNLSGNITVERKIKKDVVGEILHQILQNEKITGTIYNKLNKCIDISGITNIPYQYTSLVNGEIYQSVITDIELQGLINNNILIKNDIDGLIYNKISMTYPVGDAILKSYYNDQILTGDIFNKINKENYIYGGIFIKGTDDKNIIKKALLNFDDDELFLSILTKKYKI